MNPGDEAAFARPLSECKPCEDVSGDQAGLTKREKFAESAMQAFVTASNSNDRFGTACLKMAIEEGMTGAELLAEVSVVQADALLAALAKPPEETNANH